MMIKKVGRFFHIKINPTFYPNYPAFEYVYTMDKIQFLKREEFATSPV